MARVKLYNGSGNFAINNLAVDRYFSTIHLRQIALAAQELVKASKKIDLQIRVSGGGIHGQAEACRMGIARALQAQNKAHRDVLKKAGFLRRDSRMVERKKYGLHKARRGTQFSKR